ncbi:MAG TPA: carbohydrate kinase [Planctomycetaceae bacterium]|nr:carbohydrate kinase [Planctomycetaceae bacterium]
MNSKRIFTFGEILWDMLPSGARFGGAPANLAFHAGQLGAEVRLISAVGNDQLGINALAEMQAKGMATEWVAELNFPTGRVDVVLDQQGSATYQFGNGQAWDAIPWKEPYAEQLGAADVFCFGTLAQRSPDSRSTLRRCLEACGDATIRFLDLNLRRPFYDDDLIRDSIAAANALKVNDEEFAMIAELYGIEGTDVEVAEELTAKCNLQTLAVTFGEKGSLVWHHGESHHCPSKPVGIVDTIGAGDSYTGTLIVSLLEGLSVADANYRACRIAEYVCTQSGPAPRLPSTL